MVGGLVQNQEIGIAQHELGQGDPAPFPAAQIPDVLEHIVPGEQESGQNISYFRIIQIGIVVGNLLEQRLLPVEHMVLLVVIADLHVHAQAEASAVRRQHPVEDLQ